MLTLKLTRKTTFALTTSALTAFGMAFVASAQLTEGQITEVQMTVGPDAELSEPAPVTQDTAFLSADLNTNGELDREEFVSYAVMKADEGEADYTATRESGSYDAAFDLLDSNVDGALNPEELLASKMENETIDDKPIDWTLEEPVVEPESSEETPAEPETPAPDKS